MRRSEPKSESRRPLSLAWMGLAALLLSLAPGCGGCQSGTPPAGQNSAQQSANKQQEDKKKEDEKKKPPFDMGRFMTQPNNQMTLESQAKPGHWVSATQEVTSNHDNFFGTLETLAVDLDRTPYRISSARPLALPKGQRKMVETTIYSPMETPRRSVGLAVLDRAGREVTYSTPPLTRMRSYQFYVVVLSQDPKRYGFFDNLPSSKFSTSDDAMDENLSRVYRVMLPNIAERTPLPTHPLTWTSIAYVIWDDAPATCLGPEQQQAMLDWLHWGGQLVLSGPAALNNLRGSFLDPYLPKSEGSDLELRTNDVKLMADKWTVGKNPLIIGRSWTAEKLVAPEDVWQTTAATGNQTPLVIDRPIGNGRIVVTAFRLTQRELVEWRGYDSFINNLVLRRYPRNFNGNSVVNWMGPDGGFVPYDARMMSRLRYFARDFGARPAHQFDDGASLAPTVTPRTPMALGIDDPFMEVTRAAVTGSTVAAWDDLSGLANLARDRLGSAAQIKVPESRFVLVMLGSYLLVLVPLNWLFFTLIRRVEYAWLATPILAIIFAVVVIKQAQLNIGFARAQTELSIVETQAGYSRAHATRFLALYTSLSTGYELNFEDPSALALPFYTGAEMLTGQSRADVHYRRLNDARLSGFDVSSNSTGMLRCEQMLDLGGGFELRREGEDWILANKTSLELRDAGVIWNRIQQRVEQGGNDGNANNVATREVQVAWIGELAAGAEVKLAPRGRNIDFTLFPEWETNESSEVSAEQGTLDVRPLLSAAAKVRDNAEFRAGEIRLVGWSETPLDGLRVTPVAQQVRGATVVVAHLKGGDFPVPSPDFQSNGGMENEWFDPRLWLPGGEDPTGLDPNLP